MKPGMPFFLFFTWIDDVWRTTTIVLPRKPEIFFSPVLTLLRKKSIIILVKCLYNIRVLWSTGKYGCLTVDTSRSAHPFWAKSKILYYILLWPVLRWKFRCLIRLINLKKYKYNKKKNCLVHKNKVHNYWYIDIYGLRYIYFLRNFGYAILKFL